MDFFLLDTNLFRSATKSVRNGLMQTLVPAVQHLDYDFGAAGMAVRLSPFGLLEALGIVPIRPPWPTVTDPSTDPRVTYEEIFNYAKDKFRSHPEMQIDHMRRKLADQLDYVVPEARPLFDSCVTGILSRDIDFTEIFSSFLAQDFVFKFPFDRKQFEAMAPMLAVWFFTDFPEGSPASRYRITKRMWDFFYSTIPKGVENRELTRAHKLKTDSDFLDTDIVQDVTFGFPFDGVRHRVIALTFDDAGVVSSRAEMHRQCGFAMASLHDGGKANLSVIRPFWDHPGGVIIQCDSAGNILAVVDLAKRFPLVDQASRSPL